VRLRSTHYVRSPLIPWGDQIPPNPLKKMGNFRLNVFYKWL